MTTNEHTHCPTCISVSRDILRDGVVENLMDDGMSQADAERHYDTNVDEIVKEYLDGILAMQNNTLTTRPNTCVFIHNDWY